MISNHKKIIIEFLKKIIWYFWYFSGFRFAWEKILTPKNSDGDRKPSTFIFWFVGIYVAFFGVASQRYENRIDIVEYRISAMFSQLSTGAQEWALTRIPSLQNLKVPVKPEILQPSSIYKSLFGSGVRYSEGVKLLQEALIGQKAFLSRLDLSNVTLEGEDLRGFSINDANFTNANLKKTNLENVNLGHVNLEYANLIGANCKNADFGQANLRGANFTNADLRGASFSLANSENANFTNAILDDAHFNFTNLNNAEGLTFAQLSKLKTLYKATGIDEELIMKIKSSKPVLLENPSNTNE